MQPVNAYGPFIVDLADLLASGSTIDRLEVTAHPDLSRPTRRDLDTVAGAVRGADRRLAAHPRRPGPARTGRLRTCR